MTPSEGRPNRAKRENWVWISLLPLGLGSWAPIVAGARYRVQGWKLAGGFWAAVTIVGFANEGEHHDALAGNVLLLAWVGGIVTSFIVRSEARRRTQASPDGATGVRRDLWPWISLLPLGLGSWAPLIPAVRCRVRWWGAAGLAGAAAPIAGVVLAAASSKPGGTNQTEAAWAFLLLLGSWIAGVGVSFGIRPTYDARRGVPDLDRPIWPRPSERSRAWSARYALTAYVLTFGTVIVVGLVARYGFGTHIQVGVGVLSVDLILVLGLVPLARTRGLSLGDLGIRRTFAMRSLGLVILALGAYFALGAAWSIVFISRSTDRAANILSGVHHDGGFKVAVTVVAVSLSAPIVEEIFFRGLLYRSLRNRLPTYQAALIAGALFGLVHITGYPLITLPVKALFGVLACLLYERTGSLLPGIALHAFVDASAADISVTGNDFIVLIVTAVLVAVILLRAGIQRFIRTRSRISPLVELARASAVT